MNKSQPRILISSLFGSAVWATLLYVVIISVPLAASPRPPLYIKGVYEFKGGPTPDGKFTRELSHPFEMYIDGSKWAISTTDHSNEVGLWAVSDGNETYSLNELVILSGVPRDEAFVNNGPFPRFADMPAQLVWLAFASQDLASAKPDAPIAEAANFACYKTNGQTMDPARTIYRVAPDANGLPESAVIWCKPVFVSHEGETRHYLAPYNRGYKGGTYEVKEWYRKDGIVVPKIAEFTTLFTKRYGIDASDTQVLSHYTLKVTEVIAGRDDKKLVLLSRTGGTTVNDYRFDDVVPMMYIVKDSHWVAKGEIPWNENVKKEMYDFYKHVTHKEVIPGAPPSKSPKKLVIFGLMGIVTVFFPIVSIAYRKKYKV